MKSKGGISKRSFKKDVETVASGLSKAGRKRLIQRLRYEYEIHQINKLLSGLSLSEADEAKQDMAADISDLGRALSDTREDISDIVGQMNELSVIASENAESEYTEELDDVVSRLQDANLSVVISAPDSGVVDEVKDLIEDLSSMSVKRKFDDDESDDEQDDLVSSMNRLKIKRVKRPRRVMSLDPTRFSARLASRRGVDVELGPGMKQDPAVRKLCPQRSTLNNPAYVCDPSTGEWVSAETANGQRILSTTQVDDLAYLLDASVLF